LTDSIRLKNSNKITVSQRNEVKDIAERAEVSLSKMLHKYRFPELRKQLEKNQFGSRKESTRITNSGEHYTEGALRSTFLILFHTSGAGADLNRNGRIDTSAEASQMPCETIREIEKMWRDATNGECGWFGNKGKYADSRCYQLGSKPPIRNTLGRVLKPKAKRELQQW
jgi:hypothetical protein